MLSNENVFAFKIHKILLDVGSEVIQLSIEHKIKEFEPIPDFFRRHHNNMNNPHLRDLKRTLDNFLRSNSNQYPDSLENFDISSKIAIARNLLNSTNNSLWSSNEIEMDYLNFDKCLNNLRVIRNKYYGHLTNYQIDETKYNEILEYLKILIKYLVEFFDPNKIASYEKKITEIQNIHIIAPDEFEKFKNDFESFKEQVRELNEKYEKIQIQNELNQNLLIRKVEKIEEKINLNKEVGLISEKYCPDTRCFIKRDQDEIILDKLANKEDTDIIVLTGIGGIGKTILASYLANKLYDEFNYKYKWFDSNNDLNEKYRLILEKEFNQFETNKEYIISYLSNNLKDEKSNVLFVFDNIENIEEKKDHILKLPSKVKIIITTRNQELKITSLVRKSEKFALNTLDKVQLNKFIFDY